MCSFCLFEDHILTINVYESNIEEEPQNKDSDSSNLKGTAEEKIIAKRWKYGVFFAIWLFSAWHLSTVAEKVLIEHSVSIDSNHEQSMFFNKVL